MRSVSFGAEWTLYEQVAVAAMDCQRLDVAKVRCSLQLILSAGNFILFLGLAITIS
jgi:hypothetical protein